MEDLADRLISIIERYGIESSLINLEITETASVTSRNVLLRNMEKLIDYGFSFSLDDFGNGESNLMYVVDMPVSIIKLDYDMSKAFFSSSKAKQVVRAVVAMTHGMDLKLVAEGIETADETCCYCVLGKLSAALIWGMRRGEKPGLEQKTSTLKRLLKLMNLKGGFNSALIFAVFT